MPEDANDAWNSGFQNGISLLANRRSNLDQDLRRQQLISEDRSRRLQEAQTAQHMSMLMEEHARQVDYQAAMAKATGVYQSLVSPTVNVPVDPNNDPGGETGTQTVPNPIQTSPEDAALKAFLGPISTFDAKSVPGFLDKIAESKYRNAEARRQDRLNLSTTAIKPTAAIQNAAESARLQKAFEDSTDPAERRNLANQINALESQTEKPKFSIQMDENGKLQRVEYGAGKGAGTAGDTVTPAMANKAEESISGAVDATHAAADIIKFSRSGGTVGIAGNINRLIDTFGGQFFPVKVGDEFKFAQGVDLLRAAAARALRSDSSIAEPEREQNVANLPRTSINESPQSAEAKARNFVRIIGQSARRKAIRSGRSVPTELMTPDEIQAHVKAGEMTPEQGFDLMYKTPFSPVFGLEPNDQVK